MVAHQRYISDKPALYHQLSAGIEVFFSLHHLVGWYALANNCGAELPAELKNNTGIFQSPRVFYGWPPAFSARCLHTMQLTLRLLGSIGVPAGRPIDPQQTV